MKISFQVESNDALLMIAFHDIITGKDIDDSIAIQDNLVWLIDEIGTQIGDIAAYIQHEKGELPWQIYMFVANYENTIEPDTLKEIKEKYAVSSEKGKS